jgi:hypothetical protein
MKVTGSGSQGVGSPVPEAEATRSKASVGEVKSGSSGEAPGAVDKKSSFAETLAAGRPAASSAPARAHAPDGLTADIAADLKAGKVDAPRALERVVERILDRQLGADAPAEIRAQVRAALEDAIKSDPLIAERLRGL